MLLSWPNAKWKTISLIIFFIPCIWRFTRANIFLGDISFAFLRIRPWLELMFRISFYPWILRESAPNDLDVASDGKLCTFTRRRLNIIRANNKNRMFFARLIHLDRLHNLFFSSFLPLFYSRQAGSNLSQLQQLNANYSDSIFIVYLANVKKSCRIEMDGYTAIIMDMLLFDKNSMKFFHIRSTAIDKYF